MDIIFTCPHCDQKIEAPENYAGTEILCPACKNAIICPEPETQKVEYTSVKKAFIQNSKSSQSSQKSYKESAPFNEVVYTLLGIFLGIFGTHNFYKQEYISRTFRVISLLVALIIPAYQNNLSGLSILILGTSYLLVTFELGFQRKYTTK